ncbi:MAG: tRNA (adenosine(37)-N6)-dimethylallyltransferase MiaA [Candidatus Dojkabacteria bacterium]
MKVVIVAGPTATGKTETAIEIAKKFNGELINADSRQVYKFLDIGTNKGKLKEFDHQYSIDGIPLHLVNFLEPSDRFKLFDFQKLALDKIQQISSANKLPIIVGGTGLYIDSLVKGYLLSDSEAKDRTELDKLSVLELQNQIEPEVLNKLNNSDQNNPRRLIRVIEKSGELGIKSTNLGIETFIVYPNYDWEKLKLKIDTRVEKMFDGGLIKETQDILSKGYTKDSYGLMIMGYKQVVEYINNEIDLNTCKERVKIAHKQYAKRQRTWFEGEGRNYNLNRYSNTEEALKLSGKFIIDEI